MKVIEADMFCSYVNVCSMDDVEIEDKLDFKQIYSREIQ